uniref:Peptidase S1 domain-containing protein n=1 Tax=Anopheles quadriannulatus TaxID=34691 RepID=A0A182X933_ANOQN
MGKAVITSIVLLGAILGCQAQTETVVRNVGFGEYPSVVFVSTPRHQRCMGTVINANHVLTSGTCVMTDGAARIYPAPLVQVVGGDLSVTNPVVTQQTRVAQHIFVHEHFRPRTNDNNVAIIRLAEPFHLPSNGIEEAHIRMRIVPQGHQCDVVRATLTGNPVLQAYNVQIRNRNLCDSCCLEIFREESNICTEPITISDSLLQGDSMFCDGELTAIATTVVSNDQTREFHFNQVRFFTHWIQQQLIRTQPMPEGWSPNGV